MPSRDIVYHLRLPPYLRRSRAFLYPRAFFFQWRTPLPPIRLCKRTDPAPLHELSSSSWRISFCFLDIFLRVIFCFVLRKGASLCNRLLRGSVPPYVPTDAPFSSERSDSPHRFGIFAHVPARYPASLQPICFSFVQYTNSFCPLLLEDAPNGVTFL